MDRRFIVVTLVGAFLAPGAVATGPALPVLPLDPLVDDLGSDANEMTEEAMAATQHRVAQAAEAVERVQCPLAVRLPVTIHGGNVLDSIEASATVLDTVTASVVTERSQVPIYETVVQRLPGLLSGISREVETLTGYRLVETIEERDVDVVVTADWRERYIEWEKMEFELLLVPAAGLPFVADSRGTFVESCDEEPLVSLPSFPNDAGYDFYRVCLGCDRDLRSGWYWDLLHTDVRLAGLPGDDDLPTSDTWVSTSRLALLGEQILQAPTDFARASGVTPIDMVPIGEGDSTEDPAPRSATTIPASTVGAVGSLGSALVLLAALAVQMLRRR